MKRTITIITFIAGLVLTTAPGADAQNAGDFRFSNGTIINYWERATSLIIPDTINGQPVTIIGKEAFAGTGLVSVSIPSGITSIEAGAFEDNNLTSISVPDSIMYIGDYAFAGNDLTSVTIPDSVTSIGVGAFFCLSLIEIVVAEANPSYTSVDGVLFSKDEKTVLACPAAKQTQSYTIPVGVTSIGALAFSNNGLTSVSIPDSVTSIGDYAFEGNQLTSVNIPDSVTSIGDWAFFVNKLTSVSIPNSVMSIGRGAFSSNDLTSVSIGANVRLYWDWDFSIPHGFVNYYYNHGRKAGTYRYDGKGWSYTAQ